MLSAVICLATAISYACSVPVFRYALEKWESDPYEILVFHRGELTGDLKTWSERFGSNHLPEDEHANIRIKAVNLDDKPHADLLTIWEDQKTEELPWMVVRYPVPLPNLYEGPAKIEVLESLVDSPLRKEISDKILKGKTAVWVLLESGDKKKDDEAWKTLNKELRVAENTLELPEIAEEDIAQGLVTVDPEKLEVAFDSVRLSRDNPEEKMFVEMLLGSESDLRELEGAMAFPVFGRGRILYALIGAGINPSTILETCDSLIGECTCEVKEQNPGVDLVMPVDWENLINSKIKIDESVPELTSVASLTISRDDLEKEVNKTKGREVKIVESRKPAVTETKEETNETESTEAETTKESETAANEAETKEEKIVAEVTPEESTSEKLSETPPSKANSDMLRNTIILIVVFAIGVMGISLLVMRKKEDH